MKAHHAITVPGRINLIGEHTDYTSGAVLPAAIKPALTVSVQPLAKPVLRLASAEFSEIAAFPLDRLPSRPGGWLRYPVGVAALLGQGMVLKQGVSLTIHSTIPPGSGVSSSAALSLAVGLALLSVHETSLPAGTLVELCREVEHLYAGVRCGAMDFQACLLGREGQALHLHFGRNTSELVPLNALREHRLLLAHSRVHRALASSEYNRRREECEAISQHLASKGFCGPLGLLRPGEADAVRLPPLLQRRLRHIVSENARVASAVEALRQSQVAEFARLLDESHASLRDDFQVSCDELDEMVRLAREDGGALGARMMGGGFGGCTLNLVPREEVVRFQETLISRYYEPRGLEPLFIDGETTDGAAARYPEIVS